MSHTRTHSDFRVCRLTAEQREKTCGYWFTVTCGAMAHTAFDTIEGLRRWASERGLTIDGELSEPGACRILGSYRTTSHLVDDPAEVESMEGLHTRTLSNGDYVVAVVTEDSDGVRVVNTLNPNVHGRRVFDHRLSNWLMGGNCTGGTDGKRRPLDHLQLLNVVQSKLIAFANDSGIDLRAEFGNVEQFKRFVIAFTFKMLVDIGLDTPAAYDAVIGDGKYTELAGAVWDELSN